jgi:peptidoglycan/xylan/chitin deacetylase (PgdA/CDA1 family)
MRFTAVTVGTLLPAIIGVAGGGLAFAQGIPVAITFDDLPAAGKRHPEITSSESARLTVETLQQHRVPGVYGFVNGILVSGMAERKQILQHWKAAGFLVGNHTYSHLNLARVSAADFIADIEKNESILIDVAESIAELKWLRYPYLVEGESLEKRYAIRFYLHQRGYRVAPVTIDFDDWAWLEPYIRCSVNNDAGEIKALEASFLDVARQRLRHAVALATLIYGPRRELNHVLLLHLNAFTARMLERLLTAFAAEGVRWIPFTTAMGEPALSEDTSYAGAEGIDLLRQAVAARKLEDVPARPATPFAWLARRCH